AYYKGEDLQQASENYWREQTKDMFQEEIDEYKEVREQAEALVERYIKHYQEKGEEFKVLAVEEHFQVTIPTAKGHKSMTDLQGVFDLVVEDDTGELWLVDHKFTSID